MPKAIGDTRLHEVDFCALIASYANAIFAANPDLPFGDARVESFGRGPHRGKRKDLRFYDIESGKLALCGEVKLPGSPEGRSPYDDVKRDVVIGGLSHFSARLRLVPPSRIL